MAHVFALIGFQRSDNPIIEGKMDFTIEPKNLLNAFVFKLPTVDFDQIDPDFAEDFFIELQVSDTGH